MSKLLLGGCRYREKRKRRTFEKTIRYESRKAYAEVQPLLLLLVLCFACRSELLSMAACCRQACLVQLARVAGFAC